ncbi:P-loop containing nucleoside triphosphate hydrolase protein, partial [Mollisia scopiformis]
MTPILSTGLDGEKVVVPDALAAARRFQVKPSNAAGEWEQQKREDQEICDKKWAKPLDDLMALVGLEEVKAQFLAIKAKIDTCGEQNINLKTERFNVIFQGNPGTGKTTVANLFAAFMRDVGAIESSDDPSKKSLKVRSGATMAFKGAKGAKKSIKKLVKDAGGGTLFVDEAYQLVAPHASSEGRQVLDIILTEMEKNIGKLLVIFVGYKNEMEVFFEHNPGLGSRIPYTIHFEDFTDDELWRILCDKIEKRYSGKMRVEDGLHGLYMHIAIRRLGLGRGSKGFGNARAVENLLATISERQALRIREEVRKHKNDKVKHKDPNRFFFTKEDLIGPDPSIAKKKSKAWKELKELIGLDAVKKAVENFFGLIESNYRREISERRPIRVPLNQVFVGSPGTGKTTVARLYGRILADLGLLSRGDVVLKNPSDFIGDAVGKSEANTRGILASTAGKVLVIDEAYMLHPGDGQTDSYRNGVIDTIVAEVQGVLGEDRCVILVGYEDKLRNMFHHVNPGLSRRFPIENAFRFENFSKPELEEIMRKKMDEQDLNATDDAYRVAGDIFARALMRPNFSNAGEVETLMAKAKMNYEARYAKVPIPERPYDVEFQQEDIDPDFARGSSGESSCRLLLDGLVAEKIITRLERYQKLSMAAHRYKVEPRVLVPTCIVFKGPPGTGKTTAAHKMGKVFYDIGFLSTDEVISCTVSDLVGQYVGQTAPKTKTQLQKALGKVLIIDDAHQLKEGYYASEAANELTMFLTREENTGKIVVILIGQTYQIEELMVARPALSGLFTEEIAFEDINSRDSMSLLQRELANRHVQAPFLKYSYLEGYMKVLKVFDEIRSLLSWNNARHIQAFAKRIAATHMQEVLHDHETHDDDQDQIPPVSAETVLACLNQELFSHKSRSKKDTTDEQKNASVSPFDPSANPFRIANEIRNAPPPP